MVVVTRFGRLSGWRDQSTRCHGTSNHHFQGNDLGGRGAAADIAVPGSALLHSRWCSRWLRGSSGRASHHSWCRRPWCGCNARRWCRCPWRRGATGGRSWRGSQRRRSGQSPRTPLRIQLSDAASSIAPNPILGLVEPPPCRPGCLWKRPEQGPWRPWNRTLTNSGSRRTLSASRGLPPGIRSRPRSLAAR